MPAGRSVCGRLRPPSSKSLTQRYYNLALLARGATRVCRPLRSEDGEHFLAGLEAVGCRVTSSEEQDEVVIEPPVASGRATIDCGASGTMLRLLTASLCTVPGVWRLRGVERLHQRPLAPLIDALAQLGADLECREAAGFAPLEISGGSVEGGRVVIAAGESSQYVSALLMAAPRMPRGLTLDVAELVSAPYVELTRRAMLEFGVPVEQLEHGALRVLPAPLTGAQLVVEADASAACYPAAAALLSAGRVLLDGIDRSSAQGDVAFIELLSQMGATVDWQQGAVAVSGPADRRLQAVDVDMAAMPDQVPTLAAVAPFAAGTTVIRNVGHLRLKESDRLFAMTRELRRLGAQVEERSDGLTIEGLWADREPPSEPVVIDSHNDHRIAMSCALAGFRRPGVSIASPQVVAKSYPDFWRDLEKLRG